MVSKTRFSCTRSVAWTQAIGVTLLLNAALSCGGGSLPAAPALPTRFTVSGTVFEIAGEERRPLAGADVENIAENGRRVVATTDSEGRYSLTNVPEGTTVGLVVRHWIQPCAAVATVKGDTVLDMEVLRSRSDRTPRISPVLSGVLVTTVNGERRPFRDGAGVVFFSETVGGGFSPVAGAISDDDGRFELCRLPLGPGRLFVATWSTRVNLTGDLHLEIDREDWWSVEK